MRSSGTALILFASFLFVSTPQALARAFFEDSRFEVRSASAKPSLWGIVSEVVIGTPVMGEFKDYPLLKETDSRAELAHRQVGLVWDYFESEHQYSSFDGRSSPLRVLLGFGQIFGNAGWHPNVQVMAFSEAVPQVRNSFASALDVVAHEYTHAIVSQTSRLQYVDQSGALNEGLADIFGMLVEASATGNLDPAIGEGISIGHDRALRNLERPESISMPVVTSAAVANEEPKLELRPYPKKISEMLSTQGLKCGSQNDHCWVHYHATIIGRVGFELARSAGVRPTGRVMFEVMTQSLKPNSDFADFAQKLRAASVRHGIVSEVDLALKTVGL